MARKKTQINQENYFRVYYWMADQMGLKRDALLAYAFIFCYSTSEKGKGCYFGGKEIMSRATGGSTTQLKRMLSDLEEWGYIEKKTQILKNGLPRCYYRVSAQAIEDNVSPLTADLKKSLEVIKSHSDDWDSIDGDIENGNQSDDIVRVF